MPAYALALFGLCAMASVVCVRMLEAGPVAEEVRPATGPAERTAPAPRLEEGRSAPSRLEEDAKAVGEEPAELIKDPDEAELEEMPVLREVTDTAIWTSAEE